MLSADGKESTIIKTCLKMKTKHITRQFTDFIPRGLEGPKSWSVPHGWPKATS